MNVLNLRALTLNNQYYTFNVTDIPVLINEHHFILMRRKNSPILQLDSITSMTDIRNVGEGTVIKDTSGIDYVISFKRGFAAMNSKHEVRKIGDISNYTICYKRSNTSLLSCRQRLLFKYDDIQFQLKDFIGFIGDKGVIKKNHSLVPIDQIKQYAGITYEGSSVFFGDVINDCPVTLYKGRICLQHGEDTFIDLVDGEHIL